MHILTYVYFVPYNMIRYIICCKLKLKTLPKTITDHNGGHKSEPLWYVIDPV